MSRQVYVYFIACGRRIKIGISRQVQRRFRDIGLQQERIAQLLGTITGSFEREKAIHKDLRQYRLKGEWFRNCDEVRAYIDRLLQEEEVAAKNAPDAELPLSEQPTRAIDRLAEHLKKKYGEFIWLLEDDCPGIPKRAARRAMAGICPSAEIFLRICAESGFDPISFEEVERRPGGIFDRLPLVINLRLTRMMRGHSITDAANILKMRHSNVSNIETNSRGLDVDTMLALCRYVGEHPYRFVTFPNPLLAQRDHTAGMENGLMSFAA